MFKLGLVSISFRGNSPEDIIKAAKTAGLCCVEWGSDVHAPCKDKQKLQKISSLCLEQGLYCSSYGTYFRLGVTPLCELDSYIDGAEILGTDILRLWCGNKGSKEYTQMEKEALFEECAKAATIAQKRRVKLCMECHNGTYTDDLNAALELMNAVKSPNFRMYWQPNQHKSYEENLLYAEKISPFTEIIHVFHWSARERYPLSEGVEIWRKYMKKFDNDKTLLLEFMPDDNIETLPRETEALRLITTK